MVNEKRKKISIAEAGGDHASKFAGGSASEYDRPEKKIEVHQETRIISENIFCPVCKGNFSSMSSYNSHSCMN
jgi:hypothetical protein